MSKAISPLLILLLILPYKSSSQNDFQNGFLSRWEHMETYTLEMLDAFPDSLMAFRPTEEVATVEDHFRHIANHLTWIANSYFPGESMAGDPEADPLPIQEALKDAFELVKNRAASQHETGLAGTVLFPPAKRELSRYELLYLLLDHTRNHTGQLVVYLRLNGIAPPRYQGW